MDAMPSHLTVVGIDVGGAKKGFHAVALVDGAYREQRKMKQARELAAWCVHGVGAQVIAVDAPCRWSMVEGPRPAERALMKQSIFCFSSTTRDKALEHPTNNYGWMFCGEELYEALEVTHRLWDGASSTRERFCFETYPHAVTWHLRGGNANAERKRVERAELLRAAGIQLPPKTGIDTIDAAICALTAHLVATGAPSIGFGEGQTGVIIVPALRTS